MALFKFALLLVVPFFLQESDSIGNNIKPLPILERRLSMIVHPTEILESVIYRLQAKTGERIEYNTYELLPYRAKARVYHQLMLKEILDHQFEGTPIQYKIYKKKLVVHKKQK
jgi:hypothetical protein